MDINENENQMHEIEPLSSDPQPIPQPETDSEEEQPEEETQVVDPDLEPEDLNQEAEEGEQEPEAEIASEPEGLDQESEEEEQVTEAEADVITDPSALESTSLEILEELPVMEPDPEPEPEDEDEAEIEPETDDAPEEEKEPEEAMEPEEVLVENATEPVVREASDEHDKYAAVEKEILSDPEDLDTNIDPFAAVSAHEDPVAADGRAWYVIHCYSGNEDKVRHNILQRIESMGMDDLIFDVVVPTEDEVNIKNGERQTVEKKVFPGYILVYMILTEESWYMVRNTPGVTGFVGMGNDPTALQPEEVARILKRMESESPRINVTFRTGERVRIVDGPFEDFYGKVSEIDMDRATVRVMVNFFGRETPVELDFLQVEEA